MRDHAAATVLVPEDCADDVRQFAQQLRDRQPNGRVPETPKWRVISPSAELMGAGLGVHGPNATAACVRDQTSTRPQVWTTPTTISVTASWSVTSTSIPKAVPSVASI